MTNHAHYYLGLALGFLALALLAEERRVVEAMTVKEDWHPWRDTPEWQGMIRDAKEFAEDLKRKRAPLFLRELFKSLADYWDGQAYLRQYLHEKTDSRETGEVR